jgi:flavin-dependent dehydrogenase
VYDLIIIGAGPAGASAAITAARDGARVLLLERGKFPRHKVCGEFVSAESLGLLSTLLASEHASLLRDAVRLKNARLFLDGHKLQAAVDPPAASIARFDLDAALWDSATRAGVDARQQITVQSIEGTDPFRVTTTVGELTGRAIINASGRWSNLSRPPSRAPVATNWIGLKGHFSEPSPDPGVDLYFFDGGYCGVSPVTQQGEGSANRINACAMVRADVASTLEEVFQQNPELKARSRDWQPLMAPVTTSPLIFRKPEPERDAMLLAGDAAGFVDPFVGDGISLALRSGALAANCLLPFVAGEMTLRTALQNYRSAYRQWLMPVFRTSSRLRRMIFLPHALRNPVVALLEKTPRLTEYLVSKTR